MRKPNHLSHFTIYADDVGRAQRFYGAVFGWTFEPWGPPDFFMIKSEGEAPGVSGSLAKRDTKLTGDGLGFECTIAVDDVDVIAVKVAQAGGHLIVEKITIGAVGHLIKFTDTEGNRVGAMHYDPDAC